MSKSSIEFVVSQEKKAEKIERESKNSMKSCFPKPIKYLRKKRILAKDIEDYKNEKERDYQLKFEENQQIMLAKLESNSQMIKNKVSLNQEEVIEDIVREVVSQYGHS